MTSLPDGWEASQPPITEEEAAERTNRNVIELQARQERMRQRDERVYPSKPTPHPDILEKQLEQIGYRLRYNVRRVCMEYAEEGGLIEGRIPSQSEWRGWHRLSDGIEAMMRTQIAITFSYETSRTRRPMTWSTENWHLMRLALGERNKIDPFLEWLKDLPEWDKTERLSHLFTLSGLLKAENETKLTRWASKSTLLGVIYRAYEPGSKHDTMVVLVGAQGSGKSLFFSSMLPPVKDEHGVDAAPSPWFTDSAHLPTRNTNNKEQVEATAGKAVAEFAELAGLWRSDHEIVKKYTTTRVDTFRPAYGRYAMDVPRRWIGVGTTNDATPLPADPSGNRRWVTVQIERRDPEQVIKFWAENREQVWAEALHRYKNGERAVLPKHLEAEQAETALNFTAADDYLEGVINDLIAKEIERQGMNAQIRFSDLVESDLIKVTKSDGKPFGQYLFSKGFKKARRVPPTGGVRKECWVIKDREVYNRLVQELGIPNGEETEMELPESNAEKGRTVFGSSSETGF